MDEKFKEDLRQLSSRLTVGPPSSEDTGRISYKDFTLVHNQAIYVLSLRDKEIQFQRNIHKLLGYDDNEFNFDLAIQIVHPKDYPIIRHIVKSTLAFCAMYGMPEDAVLYLTYRVRKKDGSFIKIQRISGVCQLSKDRHLAGNYSLLQDISYMHTGSTVRWHWSSPNVDRDIFRKFVNLSPTTFFTKRELDVFREMKKGGTESEIADSLEISVHTLKSHRKHMLGKVGCKTTAEMVEFFESPSEFMTDDEIRRILED